MDWSTKKNCLDHYHSGHSHDCMFAVLVFTLFKCGLWKVNFAILKKSIIKAWKEDVAPWLYTGMWSPQEEMSLCFEHFKLFVLLDIAVGAYGSEQAVIVR